MRVKIIWLNIGSDGKGNGQFKQIGQIGQMGQLCKIGPKSQISQECHSNGCVRWTR